MSARVAFLGLSHLGIVSSAAWASRRATVVAIDPDAELVSALTRNELPVHEPGLPELIASARRTLRYSARLADLEDCAMVVVSRDVPTDPQGRSDAGVVTELVRAAIPHLAQDAVVVVMSQVAPGYTRGLTELIQLDRPQLRVRLLYLVETLIFGDAVRRATQPERFIVGAAAPDDALPDVLQGILARFGCPILPMSYESAELAKTAINLYLIGSVTYANSMADLCEAIGADWSEVVPALRLDARIGPAAYLRPGPGISGGNLRRDLETLRAIGRSHDVDLTLLDALAAHNARRSDWVLRRSDEALATANRDATIAVWGLAYKGGTGSLTNAPSLKLIRALRGRAIVRAWDPVVTASDLTSAIGPEDEVLLSSSPEDACDGADCLFVMADWDQLRDRDLVAVRWRMRKPAVVDCVGVVDPAGAARAGLALHVMGRRPI